MSLEDVKPHIIRAMQETGMPMEALPWVLAIAYGESRFDPTAARESSNAGIPGAQPEASYGLFQLNTMGGRGTGYSKATLYDPYENAKINMPALKSTWESLGGYAAASADPAGFLTVYYPKAQGSIGLDYFGDPIAKANEYLGAAGGVTGATGPVNGRGPTTPTSTMNPEGIDWGAMADQYDQLITTIMGAKPTPEEWTDEAGLDGEGYRMDLAEWQGMLTSALETRIGLDQASAGLVSLDDGTIISESQYAMLDPSARQQVDAAIANRNANLTNSYRTQLNELGLTQYDLSTSKVKEENDRLISDFNNKLAAVQQSLDFDNTNLRQAEAALDRALSGLGESRDRATLIQQAQQQQMMYGTSNGKTSFTGADLGGGVSALARQAGIGASDPVISYPGFTTMDPEGDMARFDAQFGVSGLLPAIPGLTTDRSQIPGAPGLSPNTTPLPNFLLPEAPTLTGGIGNSSLLSSAPAAPQFAQGGGPTPPGFSTNPLSQYFVDAQPQSGGLLPNGLGLADSQYLNSSAAISVLQPWRAYRPNPIGSGLLGG